MKREGKDVPCEVLRVEAHRSIKGLRKRVVRHTAGRVMGAEAEQSCYQKKKKKGMICRPTAAAHAGNRNREKRSRDLQLSG